MKPTLFVLAVVGVVVSSSTALAEKWEETPTAEQKLFWRNSLFIYENMFSAYALSRSAQVQYNPYYAQSISLRPRFYITDELSIRPRLDMEVEITTSDTTDKAHQLILSDLWLDTVWTPKLLTIPVVNVKVHPSLRLMFPTSIESRGRSMIMVLGPGFGLRREFTLRKGKWLPSVEVGYGFRGNKYFNRYASATVSELEGCQNINRPECQHRGQQNINWRFVNSLDGTLKINDRLSFGVTVLFYNNLLHQIPEQTIPLTPESTPGLTITLPPSPVNHTAATWAIFDVSYDVLDWLTLSVGTSTYYGQLADDSSYRTPLFNRETNFYLDVTIPVDALYGQIKRWTRRAPARPTAEMKGAKGLLATSY